jgi:hypothetical protein
MRARDNDFYDTSLSMWDYAFIAIVLAVIIASFTYAFLPHAHAITENATKFQTASNKHTVELIGITLSKSCELSTKCISPETLAKAFDNSNPKVSGKIIFNEKTKQFERTKAQYKNHWNYYQYADYRFVFFVLPDGNLLPHLTRQIDVVPVNFVYNLASDKKVTNNTTYDYHNIYQKDCSFARVTSDLVLQTINAMMNGCKDVKMPDGKQTHYKAPQPIKLSDFKEYQHQKWLKESKAKCKAICKEY